MSFRFRPGQESMIAAVGEAIASRQVLCLESGTGTGKTIGYLWPAIRAVISAGAAAPEPSGTPDPSGTDGEKRNQLRIVISTSTHTLQEQILRKDIPLLRQVLAGNGDFPGITVLKGRQNYLCLDRFDQWQPGVARLPVHDPSHRIVQWVRHTRTGERAEFPVPDQWEKFGATADSCHGRQCPRYQDCFLMSARREAAGSGILIVNHHLYFSDVLVRRSGGIGLLPEHDAVIFDEAHDLDDIVSMQFGGRLGRGMFASLLRDTAGYWRDHVTVPDPQTLLSVLEGDVAGYWGALAEVLNGNHHRRVGSRTRSGAAVDAGGPELLCLPSFDHSDPRFEGLRQAGGRLAGRLQQLADWFGSCADDLGLPTGSRLAAARLAGRCQSLQSEMDWFQGAQKEGHAYWAARHEGGIQELRHTPLEIREVLEEHLFTPGRAVVFVSATLTVQSGSFAFFRSRIGCPPDTVYRRIRSPFAYDRQAVLYLPRTLPSPNDPHFVPAAFPVVQRLLELTGGRTLLLCTSFAHLERFHELLLASGNFPVLRQGDAPPRELIDRFQRTPGAVLIGAMTFWQGVDIPGEALSSVIIDRIPFPSPSDPVVHFRHEYLQQNGASPFLEDSLPRALLMLRQGFGRLIRSETDQGVVTLLDPRSHRYRSAIVSTLPGGLPVCEEWGDLVRHVAGWPAVYRGGRTLPRTPVTPSPSVAPSPPSAVAPSPTDLSPPVGTEPLPPAAPLPPTTPGSAPRYPKWQGFTR